MTRDQLDDLTERYLRQSFDEIEERLSLEWTASGLEEYGSQLNERCYELTGYLASTDLATALPIARELAPDADEAVLRVLARRVLEVQLKAAKAELSATEGRPLPQLPGISRTHGLPAKAASKATPKVSEVVRMYAEGSRSKGSWTDRTSAQNEKILAIVVDLLGDPPVGDVTKEAIRQLGLDIARLPSNLTKRFPGQLPSEVLASGTRDVPILEPRSINKYYAVARAVFAWAQQFDYIAQNPASVLADVEEGRAQDARKAFDDEDVVAIFAEVERRATEPYELWIPRVMALTGCRMGEAAQLQKCDVKVKDAVWYFDFNCAAPLKNLKTTSSIRQVPVHSRLIELGWLDLVEGSADGFLFPERIRHTENVTRGNVDRLSKQLARWLRAAGVSDRKKTLQSFRATLATRLKAQSVPEYQISEILGHENDNITTGRYGKASDLQTLHGALEKLKLPI